MKLLEAELRRNWIDSTWQYILLVQRTVGLTTRNAISAELRQGVSSNSEVDICPVLHIDVINVFRQRMLIKSPIHSSHAVREYVILVRLIPLQYVAHLFTEFPQISWHEMLAAVHKRTFCCFSHRSNDRCLNICRSSRRSVA